MSRIVDVEPLIAKYDCMNEGTEFSPIHFINDLMALEQQQPCTPDCKVCKAFFEQQPCEDCISREAVIRLVEQYPNIIGNRCIGLISDIKHLPPVTPITKSEEAIHTQGFIEGVKACIEKLNEICHQRV